MKIKWHHEQERDPKSQGLMPESSRRDIVHFFCSYQTMATKQLPAAEQRNVLGLCNGGVFYHPSVKNSATDIVPSFLLSALSLSSSKKRSSESEVERETMHAQTNDIKLRLGTYEEVYLPIPNAETPPSSSSLREYSSLIYYSSNNP